LKLGPHPEEPALAGVSKGCATCATAAFLAFAVHRVTEDAVWTSSPLAWAAIIVLGAASYASPLLSTAFLIRAGFAQASANIAVAAALIAAKDMIWKPS
jgi:hypothetical protein